MAVSGLPSPGVLLMLLGLITGTGATLTIPGEKLLSDILRLSDEVLTVSASPQNQDCRDTSAGRDCSGQIRYPGVRGSSADYSGETGNSSQGSRGMAFLEIGFLPGAALVAASFEAGISRKSRSGAAGSPDPAAASRSGIPSRVSAEDRSFSEKTPGVLLGEFLAEQALAYQEQLLARRYPLKGLPLSEKRRLREILERERERLPEKVLDTFISSGAVFIRTDGISAVNRLRLLGVYAGMVYRILKNDFPVLSVYFLGIILDAGITRYLKLRDGYLPVPRRYSLSALGTAVHIGAVPVLLIPFLLPPAVLPAVCSVLMLTLGVCVHTLIINLSARPSSDLLNQE
ncbi:hypothetical protein [Succinimonas amylolytica]|uniref:hypothetical protein n=1 Tax=Succinimonas amylolytica TaxID=83769 RepID=UPI0023A7EECF